MKTKKIVSVFDGLSCAQIAINNLGCKDYEYIASEVDKYSMKVCLQNYPNTKQLGSIEDIDFTKIKDTYLLVGGSPCQSFSRLGNGAGFDGKSKLFFEYLRALDETKPKYFLLENVSMKREWRDEITKLVGVEPISLNSAKLSAQNRPRLYWTNIPNILEPIDLGLKIIDVVNPIFSDKYPKFLDGKFGNKIRKDYIKLPNQKASCLTASMYNGQTPSFCKNEKGEIYKYTAEDLEALQTIPKGYTNHVSKTQRMKMIGNGMTVRVIEHLLSNIF